MNLMDLFVKVAYDDKDVEKGIEGTSKKGAGFASKLGGVFGGVAKVVGAISAAAVAVGGAFVKGAMDVSDYGSEINDMSQKLNISKKGFQEWKYILGQSGTDIGVLQMGLKTLSSKAVEGSAAFDALGISQEQLSSLSTEELFNKTIEQLSGMEAGNERTALAADLFGRSATELLPILNEGAGGLAEMRKQAEDYGLIMSDEAIAASDAFGDSVSLMKQTLTGLKNRMMGEFLPALTLVTDGLAKLFTGDTSGIEGIGKGLKQFFGQIAQAMPQIIELGGSILTALVGAIIENFPLLVSATFNLVSTLAEFILQNLPMLIDTAFQILMTLALGISEQLPTLIPTIIDVVLTIVDALVKNAPLLTNAALQLMIGLTKGLINAIPVLVRMIPKIVISMVAALIEQVTVLMQAGQQLFSSVGEGVRNAAKDIKKIVGDMVNSNIIAPITQAWDKLVEVGGNVVKGIWQGITNGTQWIFDKIKGWVGSVVGYIKKLFGIKSPSTVMREGVGKYLSFGLGDGILKYAGYAKDAMTSLMDGVMGEAYNPTISASVNGSAGLYGSAISNAVSATRPINLSVPVVVDGREIARATASYTSEQLGWMGA